MLIEELCAYVWVIICRGMIVLVFL